MTLYCLWEGWNLTYLLRAYTSRRGRTVPTEEEGEVRGHTPSAFPARVPNAGRSTPGQLRARPEVPGSPQPPTPREAVGRLWQSRESQAVADAPASVFSSSSGGRENGGRKEKSSRDTRAHLPSAAFEKQIELLRVKGIKRGRGQASGMVSHSRQRTIAILPAAPGDPRSRDPAGGAEQRGSLFKGSNKGSRKNKRDGNWPQIREL